MTKSDNKTRSHSRLDSFGFAVKGLKQVFLREPNFRIQLLVAILVIPLSVYLNSTAAEIATICLCCGFVLVCEAANTVIEELVDLVHPQRSEKAGRIKDMAAAIPLIAALISAVVGLIILLPKMILFLQTEF